MNNQHLLEQKAHPQGWAFLLFWKMQGWRDRRGAGVEIRQTARAIRAQNVRPHARGEGATAGATARASWVRVYQRGLWGLGRAWALGAWRLGGLGAWALGRLGRLGAWETWALGRLGDLGTWALGRLGRLGAWGTWALGRLGDLGRTSLRGRGFPALGFTGAGFTGVASGRASRGLPADFRRASRGLSGGLFRRAFPADARLGWADSSFLNSLPCAGATKRRRAFWARRREWFFAA